MEGEENLRGGGQMQIKLYNGRVQHGRKNGCPPHHWIIGMVPVGRVYLAKCKKCRDRKTFPYAPIDDGSRTEPRCSLIL